MGGPVIQDVAEVEAHAAAEVEAQARKRERVNEREIEFREREREREKRESGYGNQRVCVAQWACPVHVAGHSRVLYMSSRCTRIPWFVSGTVWQSEQGVLLGAHRRGP